MLIFYPNVEVNSETVAPLKGTLFGHTGEALGS
jgi:hypothetical protein